MKWVIIVIGLLSLTSRSNATGHPQQDSVQLRYLSAQKILGEKFSGDFYPNYSQLHRLSEKAFVAKINSSAREFYALLDSYRQNLPPAYISSQRFEIKMYFDRYL